MDKDDVINEIQLQLSHPGNQSVFVVVEGQDDCLFFKLKLSSQTELIESYSGKKGVKEIVSYFQKKQVIGICDRDYQQVTNGNGIFYYDNCCLEMMIIANDEAMGQLWADFYDGALSPQQLRQTILQELKWISVFRKKNAENNWGVNFGSKTHFPVPKVFDNHQNFQLQTAEQIIDRQNRNFIANHPNEYAVVQNAWRNDPNDLNSLLQITQGHDFVSCFKLFCTDNSKKAPASDAVEHSLRCAFHMTQFEQTDLYADLKTYEQHENLCILA